MCFSFATIMRMVPDVYEILFSVNDIHKTDFFVVLINKITFILIITLLSIIIGVDHSPTPRKNFLKLHLSKRPQNNLPIFRNLSHFPLIPFNQLPYDQSHKRSKYRHVITVVLLSKTFTLKTFVTKLYTQKQNDQKLCNIFS